MPVHFIYAYHDASNYKQNATAVFEGRLAEGDWERLQAAAEGGEDFVASQVGLDCLQPYMISFPSEDDHGFHELVEEPEDIPSSGPDGDAVTDNRTWEEFLAEFEAAGKAGWDPLAECEELGIDLAAPGSWQVS